ncbi:MAG: hydantoinase/oxoprolinase family protein [Actinomycetia bacterium]|nr:hydantoinase/oxoprolinase family protein [Actinomycetes bacterium]
MAMRVGVDTGGTFTDLMAWSDEGDVRVQKVPSTPDDDTRAFLEGLGALGDAAGFAPGDVASIGHGTTVALNAVLQKQWLPIGLLVTTGYREVIEIARQTVPGDWGSIYTWVKPPRVVPLEHVREVDERLSHEGELLEPLDEEGVRAQAVWFRERGIDSVAVCFIHSYADPVHEQRARELIREEHPDCFVSISSDVLPEFREYERAMTTCLDAVLMPLVSDYLERLTGRLDEGGYESSLLMMKSMGGLSRHDKVVDQPITIAYSGPSAGVLGMAWLAEKVGESRVLTYDMGGTSTDVALVEDGRPLLTTEGSLDIYPMKTPTIDLVSIGAGGGSIATLGTGNRLRVGPESAGADPGPACYGRGGTEATVTDANLVLGRIPPALLSGTLALDEEAARAAVGTIAAQLVLSLEEAAYGILEIAAFTMAGAVREVSVKRGRDPREYALFAYGGAGPLHAAQLASLLGISRIVIPASPGLGSCIGLLAADIKETAVQTVPTRQDQPGLAELGERFVELEDRVQKAVVEQGIEASQVELERLADMRYVGMATELTITVPSGKPTLESMRLAFDAFHAAHERAYGYAYRGEQLVEVINVRVSGTGPLSFIDLSEEPVSPAAAAVAAAGRRAVYFGPEEGAHECALYERRALGTGCVIRGPAIVEQYDSTIVVPPWADAAVDGFRNLVIERR